MDILEAWFGGREKPRWRENYDKNIHSIGFKTNLTTEQLKRLADVLQELDIIKL